MVAANLALGAYQQRLAEQFDIEPGAEQRAAIDYALEHHHPVLLIDREIGITLKRVLASVSWWRRFGLFAGLLASVVSKEEVSEEEIESLKEGDVLESTFAEFAEERQDLYGPLIDERDRYMAERLLEEVGAHAHERVLAVVGAGHMGGIQRYLSRSAEQAEATPAEVIAELDRLPTPKLWPKTDPLVDCGAGVCRLRYRFLTQPGAGLGAGHRVGADQRYPLRFGRTDCRSSPADRYHCLYCRPHHLA